MSKYRNRKTEVDGVKFDSQAEANRWLELRIHERVGEVSNIRRQVSFPLVVNGIKVCVYRADFVYAQDGREVVEDVKGVRTAEYKLKRKLMLACHGIEISEVIA